MGFGGDELEVDAVPGERVAVPVAVALRDDATQHVVQPRRREVEVEEPRARDLDPLEVRGAGPLELVDEPGGDLARRDAQRLGQLERDVGGEVAVTGVLRRRQLDAARRLGEPGRVERGVESGEELVTDHVGSPARGALRRSPCPRIVGAPRSSGRFVRLRAGSSGGVPGPGYRRSVAVTVRERVQPVETNESLVDSARTGSGIATIYLALDHLVAQYELEDAAVVVDVPGLGRQVLHAGRRPLHVDEHRLHAADPGLYLDPPLDDPVLAPLMLAVSALGLRVDATTVGDAP